MNKMKKILIAILLIWTSSTYAQSMLGSLPEKYTTDSPCQYYRYGTNDKILAYFDVDGPNGGAYAKLDGKVVKLTTDYKNDVEIFRYKKYTMKMRRDDTINDDHYLNTITVHGDGKTEVIKVYQNCEP